jgi:hypothetical protein
MFKKIKNIIFDPLVLSIFLISVCISLIILAIFEFIKIYF